MGFEAAWAVVIDGVKANIAFAQPMVFVLGFAEGIPAISLFVPSSALFLAIGGVHGATGGHFWHLWLAASAGAVLGDCVTYAMGRWLRHDVERFPALIGHKGALAAGHALFERWGPLAVLGGKFTGFARPFIPLVAGIMTMPWPLFLGASIVSSMAWAGVFLAPGYGIRLLFD